MTDEQDELPPQEIAERARDEALESLSNVQKMHDEAKDLAPAEDEVLRDFADSYAEALLEGFSHTKTDVHAAMLADEADYHNKTNVKNLIQEAVEQKKGVHEKAFDEVLRENLDEVVVVRTTDAKQDTLYRWHLKECKIETTSSGETRTHFSWNDFRELYFDASGNNAGKPKKEYRDSDSWRDFVTALIDERGKEVETRGPRTAAAERLQDEIRNSTGYSDIDHMIERDGVYIEVPTRDIPEWWGNLHEVEAWAWECDKRRQTEVGTENLPIREVRVPNHIIKRVAEGENVGERALQVELDARNCNVPRLNGSISETRFVNGNNRTWWVLSPDFAVPQVYEKEPRDPADMIDEPVSARSRDEDEEIDAQTGAVGGDL